MQGGSREDEAESERMSKSFIKREEWFEGLDRSFEIKENPQRRPAEENTKPESISNRCCIHSKSEFYTITKACREVNWVIFILVFSPTQTSLVSVDEAITKVNLYGQDLSCISAQCFSCGCQLQSLVYSFENLTKSTKLSSKEALEQCFGWIQRPKRNLPLLGSHWSVSWWGTRRPYLQEENLINKVASCPH